MAANSRKKGRKRNGMGYVILIVILMLLAAVTGLSVFFKVSDITVTGLTAYDEAAILTASGIEEGDSIFFINESSIASRLKKDYPYIDEVRIVRQFPGTVTIRITESFPAAYLRYSGSIWVIDKNGRILEKTGTEGTEGRIEVTGLTPIMPEVGSPLALGEGSAVRLQSLREVLTAILSLDMQGNVGTLDMENIGGIELTYLDRFTIRLGKGEAAEDKLLLAREVVALKTDYDRGTIDVSNQEEAHYIPG